MLRGRTEGIGIGAAGAHDLDTPAAVVNHLPDRNSGRQLV